jgi:hypothetical protein
MLKLLACIAESTALLISRPKHSIVLINVEVYLSLFDNSTPTVHLYNEKKSKIGYIKVYEKSTNKTVSEMFVPPQETTLNIKHAEVQLDGINTDRRIINCVRLRF